MVMGVPLAWVGKQRHTQLPGHHLDRVGYMNAQDNCVGMGRVLLRAKHRGKATLKKAGLTP